jgi:D-xylose transport system substrate-binding protein
MITPREYSPRRSRLSNVSVGCKLIYNNANQDAARLQQQAEAALTQGAKVLVVTPVDSKAAAAIANRAKQSTCR